MQQIKQTNSKKNKFYFINDKKLSNNNNNFLFPVQTRFLT